MAASLATRALLGRGLSSVSRGALAPSRRHMTMDAAAAANIPLAKYGGRYTVSLMPGDGIGPEMTGHVQEVFHASGAPVDFETVALDPTNDNYDDLHNAIASVQRNGCALKGNIETQMNRPDIKSRNVEMRNELDLFVNVVRCQSQPGIKTRHDNVDIVLVRQNTEGEYAMLEHENVPGVVESLKVMTETNTERLCRHAFEYAKEHGRKKVTLVHKANIMKITDGLFLDVCTRVAQDYPEIAYDNMIIDNCCMQLVSNPWQFDVMVLTNLYGTIISNLVCGLIGGPGILSGSNYGPRYALFEPATRNAAAHLVGRDVANPCAMLNAGADLLQHLRLDVHAERVRSAIRRTINEDRVHTKDLGGEALSSEVVANVLKHVRAEAMK